ncbi:MAG: hypothetical protein GKR89_31630 [Candidatus Latescibacteria bacterium]|nr:hypothetical protein [Candidatus Latescibacterota bacterium]
MSAANMAARSKKLRVGVVGCGAMGQNHLGVYQQLGDAVEIAALCDANPKRLEAAAKSWPQARTSADFQTFLEPADLDLVSVCTMPQSHCEIAVAALEKGAHVLCEKPFAMELAQADRMLATAARAGRHIQVGTNMRHMRDTGILRDLVASGKLGKPAYIRAWTYYPDIPWWGPHMIKAVSSGGALASTAIHILDAALYVAGSPDPLTVSGSTHRLFPNKRLETAPSSEARQSYDVEDIAVAHIRLSDGISLVLEGTWAHELRQSHYSFEIICERGTISLTPLSILMDEGGKIVDRTADYADTLPGGDSWGESVEREISGFVTAIRQGGTPSQSPREIRNLQCVQDAIYQSAEMGCEIRLDQ